jgi:hypothetical protein
MKKILFSLVAAALMLHANDAEKVESLEKRIDSLEAIIQEQNQQEQMRKMQTAMQSTNSFNQLNYIPDISLILDASYTYHSMKDEELKHLEIPGIAHGLMGVHTHSGGSSHAPLNAYTGFNLNYAELALHSVVDPYFELDGVFHTTEYGFEIEEAYMTTTALGHGLLARAGKFRSRFGRINQQHNHAQDFADMPLVYTAFLGAHGIDDIGAQLQWTLPTSTYLMVGIEAFQGKNPSMYGNAAIAPEGDEENIVVASADQPNLLVGYVKSSFDLDNTTFLYGVSVANGESRINHLEDEEPHAFAGRSILYGADLTIKHFFGSYSYLTFQGEYLYRDMDGDTYRYPEVSGTVDDTTLNAAATVKKQSGYYAQLVYALNQNYRIGARVDNINKNDITVNNTAQDTQKNFNKFTVMADYSTSEFARFRLQYDRNNAMYNEEGERQHIDTVILQMNLAIGAHGAHNF